MNDQNHMYESDEEKNQPAINVRVFRGRVTQREDGGVAYIVLKSSPGVTCDLDWFEGFEGHDMEIRLIDHGLFKAKPR